MKPIRWTIGRASDEFGPSAQAITARIKQAGVLAGSDGRFSTRDMAAAIFGDFDGEKLGLVREQREKLALENAQTRREMVSLVSVAEFMGRVFTAMKGRILAANLELEDKEQILHELGQLLELANPEREAGAATAPEDEGEPVGDTVPVSEQRIHG